VKDLAQLGERVHLAWKILRSKDTSLVRHVRREVEMVDPNLVQNFVDITRVFVLGRPFKAESVVISMLLKVLAWEVLIPRIRSDYENHHDQ
jgi:hypothetical protein